LFALDLIHVSNGLTDVDNNQLTTPEFTVTEIGKSLELNFKVETQTEDSFQLNVYILNELYHRLPDRLYSTEVFGFWVGCCYHHFVEHVIVIFLVLPEDHFQNDNINYACPPII